jgi:predicted DCC family thiol-disulfide oxidoreductase YuxK
MRWVLFFDGECGFCTRWVRRVHHLDRRGEIDFAPLQGTLGRSLGLEKHARKGGGTLVLLREEDGVMFYKSDAVIEVGRIVGGVWEVLAMALWMVPSFLRNRIYDLVARNRGRLRGGGAGQREPDGGLRARMRD